MSLLEREPRPVVIEPILHSEEVSIKPPLNNDDNPKGPPYRLLIMGGLMALMIGAMITMMTLTGFEAIKRNPMMGMMMVMMPMMMIMGIGGSLVGSSGMSQSDADTDRRLYQRHLQESRKTTRRIASGQHALAVFRFPHPDNLANMIAAGDDTMWRTTYNPNPEETADGPFMQARVGVGFIALDPPIVTPPAQIADNLEPFTTVAFERFLMVQGVVPRAPIAWELTRPAYGFRGVTGEKRLALVRAMLTSLMYAHSPTVLTVAVVTDREDAWDWLKWAPHNLDTARAMGPGGYGGLCFPTLGAFETEIPRLLQLTSEYRKLIVVIDTPHHEAKFGNAEFNTGVDGICFLVVNAASDEAMTSTQSRFHLSAEGNFSGYQATDVAVADLVSASTAEAITRNLAAYRPPNFGYADEQTGLVEDAPVDVPSMVNALGVDALEEWDVLGSWADAEWTNTFKSPFGYVVDTNNKETGELAELDIIELDRSGTGPHGALSGGTGTGKSHLIRALLLMMLAKYSPDKLVVILMDFKGGSTFAPFTGLPHILANITNLKGSADMVARSMDVLEGELTRRQELLDEYKVDDVYEYRALRRNNPDMAPLPDLLLLVDELRELLLDERNLGFLVLLGRIGQIGRSLGVHQLLASQFIDEGLIRDAIQHMTYGISLKVGDTRYSQAVLRDPGAASLPPNRIALFRYSVKLDTHLKRVTAFNWTEPYRERHLISGGSRVVDGELVSSAEDVAVSGIEPFTLRPSASTFAKGDTNAPVTITDAQYEYRDTGKNMMEAILDKVREAGRGFTQVYQLWSKPLSVPMTLADFDGDFGRSDTSLTLRIGDVDKPFEHCRVPWVIDFTDQHYAIVGDSGSGRTTVLRTLVAVSAFSYVGSWASWFIYDYTSTQMAPMEGFPNVSMYTVGSDEDGWYRMIGELRRVLAVRKEAFDKFRYRNLGEYFEAKDPLADPYHHIFLAIDGYIEWFGDVAAMDLSVRDEYTTLFREMQRVGIHVIATMTPNNQMSKAIEPFQGNIQLSMAEPMNNPRITRYRTDGKNLVQSGIPSKQPGRAANFDFVDASNNTLMLHARVAVPVMEEVQPKSVIKGIVSWEYKQDWTPQIEALGPFLSDTSRPSGANQAPKVTTVGTDVPLSNLLGSIRMDLIRQNPITDRSVPFGLSRGTAYPVFHNPAEHVAIVGDPKSGRTTALRTFMSSVMNAYTSAEARFVVFDTNMALLSEVDFLVNTGYMRPENYATTESKRTAAVGKLCDAVLKRHRPEDATTDQIRSRSFVTGPEMFVFIDDLESMSQPPGAFGATEGTLERLVEMLPTYDVGVHLIFTMTAATFMANQTRNKVLKNLMEKHQMKYLMLSGTKSYGKPFLGVPLMFETWPAGRGRWVDKAYTSDIVQVANTGEHTTRM